MSDEEIINSTIVSASNNRYYIDQHIGGGVYGEVYKATCNNNSCALKIFNTRIQEMEECWQMEVDVLKCAKNSKENNFLVQFYEHGMLNEAPAGLSKHFIAMELLGQSLYDVQKEVEDGSHDEGKLYGYSVRNIRDIGFQIATALQFLHQNNFLHLDLKPENVLFVNLDLPKTMVNSVGNCTVIDVLDSRVKVGDFGCSSKLKEGQKKLKYCRVQTPNYRAIENFLGLDHCAKADVWSLGCILSELYTGELLFFGTGNDEGEEIQLDVIQTVLKSQVPQYMMKAALKNRSPFVEVCPLNDRFKFKKPNKNPVFVRSIFTTVRKGDFEAIPLFELILKTLKLDPEDRIDVKTMLKDKFFIDANKF